MKTDGLIIIGHPGAGLTAERTVARGFALRGGLDVQIRTPEQIKPHTVFPIKLFDFDMPETIIHKRMPRKLKKKLKKFNHST